MIDDELMVCELHLGLTLYAWRTYPVYDGPDGCTKDKCTCYQENEIKEHEGHKKERLYCIDASEEKLISSKRITFPVKKYAWKLKKAFQASYDQGKEVRHSHTLQAPVLNRVITFSSHHTVN